MATIVDVWEVTREAKKNQTTTISMTTFLFFGLSGQGQIESNTNLCWYSCVLRKKKLFVVIYTETSEQAQEERKKKKSHTFVWILSDIQRMQHNIENAETHTIKWWQIEYTTYAMTEATLIHINTDESQTH